MDEFQNPEFFSDCMKDFRCVCYYLSSNLPSMKVFEDFNEIGAAMAAKQYFTTWAMEIQRIDVLGEGSTKVIHSLEINATGTTANDISFALHNKSFRRLQLLKRQNTPLAK